MKTSQRKGFSAVEAIIILVAVVIIGALAYTWYTRSSNTTSAPKTTDSSNKEASTVQTELEAIKVDEELDTSEIDAALE